MLFIERGRVVGGGGAKSSSLKACSRFLLNGSLFNFQLILLFASKTNIPKFPTRRHKQVEGGLLVKGVLLRLRLHPLSPLQQKERERR